MATITTSNLADEIKTHYVMRLLMRAFPRLVHGRWGQRAIIPKRAGGTLEWRRFGALSAVTSALGESDFAYGGTPPAPTTVTVTPITATPLFYGAYVEYTDDIEMKSIDPILEAFSDVLGEQAGKSVDGLTRTTLIAGFTTKVYGGAATSNATLQPGDDMDFPLFATALGTLLANDALPPEGDKYVAILHPHTWVDMIQDATIHKAFQAKADASGENPFASGYIGDLLNVKLYITSQAYTVNDAGATGAGDSYYTIFLGQEAYGITGIEGREARDVDTGLDGSDPQTGKKIRPVDLILKPIGSAGTADPMDEVGTVAWKFSHAAKVLQVNFAVLAIHSSSLGIDPA